MKIRIMSAVLLMLGVIVLSGPVSGTNSDGYITLERGICFGTCPVYSVTLFGNGTILYKGVKFVREVGIQNGTITESDYQNLLDQIRKAGFFAMNDSYTAYMITDLPSAALTVHAGNLTKKIDHYHGDRTAPEVLSQLEDAVDQAARVTQWTDP